MRSVIVVRVWFSLPSIVIVVVAVVGVVVVVAVFSPLLLLFGLSYESSLVAIYVNALYTSHSDHICFT